MKAITTTSTAVKQDRTFAKSTSIAYSSRPKFRLKSVLDYYTKALRHNLGMCEKARRGYSCRGGGKPRYTECGSMLHS